MTDGRDRYPPVFKNPGDWVTVAGVVALLVSVFALPWIKVGVDLRAFGRKWVDEEVRSVGLLEIPWYWIALLIAVLAAMTVFFFVTRTRGAVTLGAGIYYLLFSVLFFVGAWYKINAIIGDIARLVGRLPFGGLLEGIFREVAKNVLDVRMGAGFYLFIAAGVLMAAGGSLRLAAGLSRRGEVCVRGTGRGTDAP